MSLLVISGSLNPESNSRVLAREAHRVLIEAGHAAEFLDLRDLPLPLCDGATAYSHPQVAKARALIGPAAGILVASPIYNYDASAAVKNLVELTGRGSWENKIVGFACASGGAASYMSIMALANSLMLDFRCTIVPRFVYSVETDFKAELITNPDVARRTAELALALARYATALKV
jgi:FMN reductase